MFPPQPEHVHSYGISARAINLPSYHDMSAGDLERVVRAVEDAYARKLP
jgi:perosamine synthetase